MSDFAANNPYGGSLKVLFNFLHDAEYLFAGQHISRQISRSLMAQPSITEYNKFFRYSEMHWICYLYL